MKEEMLSTANSTDSSGAYILVVITRELNLFKKTVKVLLNIKEIGEQTQLLYQKQEMLELH